MDQIGVKLRSKIPVLQLFRKNDDNKTEETFLLDSTSSPKSNKNYTELFSVENTNMFNQVDNDLIEYTGDGVAYQRIDEWQAGWNVTNAIQGMFVVSLPYAVANGGYWALLAMLVVAYVCCYTGKILVDCLYDDDDDEQVTVFFVLKICKSKRRNRIRASYVDIAKDVWGSQIGARVVNIAQNIELLMTCILYLVLCGDLFVGSFPDSLEHSAWTMISCMVLIPCAFIRSLRFVSRLSFCNAIVHLAINIIILAYCFTRFREWDVSKIEYKINMWSFPISLGIIVFSYTSQIFLPTLEGSMYERQKFNSMLDLSHLCAAIFKALFGLIGFLTWQEDTDEVITNNLPTKQLKVLVNMILVIKALLSYPLPYFASVELLESTLFYTNPNMPTPMGASETGAGASATITSAPSSPGPHHHRPAKGRSNSMHSLSTKPLFTQLTCYDPDGDLKMWAVVSRIGLILFTLFLAIFIPHFAILMGLIGSITGTMLSLIWPCYFHLRLKSKSMKWYQRALDIAIIVFGLLITVTGIFYSSVALVKALRQGPPGSNAILRLNKDYYKNNQFFMANRSDETAAIGGVLNSRFNVSMFPMKPFH